MKIGEFGESLESVADVDTAIELLVCRRATLIASLGLKAGDVIAFDTDKILATRPMPSRLPMPAIAKIRKVRRKGPYIVYDLDLGGGQMLGGMPSEMVLRRLTDDET